jgi:hypothetical protein
VGFLAAGAIIRLGGERDGPSGSTEEPSHLNVQSGTYLPGPLLRLHT